MKRILLFFVLLLSGLLLIGCDPNQSTMEESTLETVRSALTIPEQLESYQLPTEQDGVTIRWSANHPDVLSDDFITIQQAIDVDVVLTASLEQDGKVMTKLFFVTILLDPELVDDEPDDPVCDDGFELIDGECVEAIDPAAQIKVDEVEVLLTDALTDPMYPSGIEVTDDLTLPVDLDGVSILWLSDQPAYLSDTGVVQQPGEGDDDAIVTLTAELSYDGVTSTLEFTIVVLAEVTTVIYDGYYAGADGLTGELLKAFLHELIDDHTVLSYAQLWDALAITDEDPNNPDNVILLYSGTSMDEDNHGGDQTDWNREHVWPRSHGDLEDLGGPAYTDLHHIRPTLVPVNGARGNLDFDEGGTLVSGTTDCYKDGDSFEPRDEVKGDVARMMFYMAVRYEGGSGELDLELNDNVNNDGPFVGRLSVLLTWHYNDLPDAFERARNEAIFGIQGNRNPFVDHPDFVTLIFGS